MVKNLISLTIGLLIFSQPVVSGELLNVGIRVDIKYESFGESCHLRGLFKHYNISLETDQETASRGQLTKLNVFGPKETQILSQPELASFVIRNDQNLTWIKSALGKIKTKS